MIKTATIYAPDIEAKIVRALRIGKHSSVVARETGQTESTVKYLAEKYSLVRVEFDPKQLPQEMGR